MRYGNVRRASFIDRPNRFIARVWLDGRTESVHVKNTGRCRELLVPGCRVVLARGANPARKTPFDLIAVYKVTPEHPEGWLFNIDSQAPNAVVGEWLASFPPELAFSQVRPEFRFGASRVDFYLERDGRPHLLEVKGCTLEVNGVGYFPDAPTERGAKHLRELTAAVRDGYTCTVAFVIQMAGVTEVRPNIATDPAFAEDLAAARAAGVFVLPLACAVTPDSLRIATPAAPWF